MTKLRSALSPHRALVTIVDRIGWHAAELLTGRRERSIRKWSEPDVGPGVPLEDALKLDLAYIEATGATIAPFEAWYTTQLQIARARASVAMASRAERLADACREVGEAFAAHAIAASPGAGERERRAADRETDEAIVALICTRSAMPNCGEAL